MSDWFVHFGFAAVGDDLLMGAYPQDADDVAALQEAGVTAVFNLVQDVEYELAGGRDACAAALARAGIREERVEVVDYGNLLPDHIELAATTVLAWLDAGERVYVHCRAGWQRSAVVAAAALALHDGIDPEEALARIKRRKPSSEPLPHQLQDLRRWWRMRLLREGS